MESMGWRIPSSSRYWNSSCPGKLHAAMDRPGDPAIGERHIVLDPRSCRETRSARARPQLDMARAQRREAERVILPRVFLDCRRECASHRAARSSVAQHALARQPRHRPSASSTRRRRSGKHASELEQAVILGRVTQLAPARVVAVLLTRPRASRASRLNVAAWIAAQPDLLVRGRHRELDDALQGPPSWSRTRLPSGVSVGRSRATFDDA